MSLGTVKFFNDAKGFGFITPDDGTDDLFVHFDSIQATGHRTLTKGQRVQFRGEMAPKGPVAKDVRPLPSAS